MYRDFRKLINHLRISDNNVELEVANGIFLRNSTSVKAEYITQIKELSDSEVKNVDFLNEREKTVQLINEYV